MGEVGVGYFEDAASVESVTHILQMYDMLFFWRGCFMFEDVGNGICLGFYDYNDMRYVLQNSDCWYHDHKTKNVRVLLSGASLRGRDRRSGLNFFRVSVLRDCLEVLGVTSAIVWQSIFFSLCLRHLIQEQRKLSGPKSWDLTKTTNTVRRSHITASPYLPPNSHIPSTITPVSSSTHLEGVCSKYIQCL